MIDGIKTGYLPLDVNQLSKTLGVKLNQKTVYANLDGLIFGFIEEVDKNTGELRYMSGIRGSVHKFKNHGTHNADSFHLSDLRKVFNKLREQYSINPDITRLYSVEFGVNIKPECGAKRVLNAIRMYKGQTFAPMGKVGLIYESNLYNLKIYDKGKQCGIPEYNNVLRIEIKATRSYLKRKGVCINLLGDLLDSELWKQFEYILLEAIGNTMIFEAIQVDSLEKKEKALFSLFIGDGWQMLNKVTLCRRKKKFEELICKLGLSTIKEELTKLIKAECCNLRDLKSENCNRINVFTTANTSLKVKDTNKQFNKDLDKNATESTFFENTSKDEKCNQINIKIKGDLIAGCTMKTAVPPDTINPIPGYTNKIKHKQIRVQNRGKPKKLSSHLMK